MLLLALSTILLQPVTGQESKHSAQCKIASTACEHDTDCIHRLAVLQSTCITNTCQPQCRNAVLNLFQNRLGRALLRTDVSCIPGRFELEQCNLIPNRRPLHCNLAKLTCEADLMCSARWQVFVSECEPEVVHRECSARCRQLLNETMHSGQGVTLNECTCVKNEDKLCEHLRDVILGSCIKKQGQFSTSYSLQPHDSSGGSSTSGYRPSLDSNRVGLDNVDDAGSSSSIFVAYSLITVLQLSLLIIHLQQ